MSLMNRALTRAAQRTAVKTDDAMGLIFLINEDPILLAAEYVELCNALHYFLFSMIENLKRNRRIFRYLMKDNKCLDFPYVVKSE